MPGALQVMYLNAPLFQMKKWAQSGEMTSGLILLSYIPSPVVCPWASLLTFLG